MASLQPETTMTEADYLAFDAENDFKSEYADGKIYMMAGASRTHINITGNIFGYLFNQLLNSDCQIVQSDMRVKVESKTRKNRYRYPDIVIICGEPDYTEDAPVATLNNPTVLFEVLSPSTASVDTIQKVEEYRQINTVQHYLIAAQSEVRVMHYQRQSQPGKQWLYADYTSPDEEVELTSIGCVLKLADIYHRVEFPPEEDES